jgi:hypothetical protein
MTISNSYRLFFSGKILMLLMQLNNYSRKFKLSKPVPSRESVVIMEENLRMPDLKNSSPITPQQNRVVEQKNRVIQ